MTRAEAEENTQLTLKSEGGKQLRLKLGPEEKDFRLLFKPTNLTMAGASTTQFMNQKLLEETPIFSKVFSTKIQKMKIISYLNYPLPPDESGFHPDPPTDSPCSLQLTYCDGTCQQVNHYKYAPFAFSLIPQLSTTPNISGR